MSTKSWPTIVHTRYENMGPILKTHYDGGHKFTVRKIDRSERYNPEYIMHSWYNGKPVGEYETNDMNDAINTGLANIRSGRSGGIMESSLNPGKVIKEYSSGSHVVKVRNNRSGEGAIVEAYPNGVHDSSYDAEIPMHNQAHSYAQSLLNKLKGLKESIKTLEEMAYGTPDWFHNQAHNDHNSEVREAEAGAKEANNYKKTTHHHNGSSWKTKIHFPNCHLSKLSSLYVIL